MLKAREYFPAVGRFGAKWMPEDIIGSLGLPYVGEMYYVDAANGDDDNNGGKAQNDAFATVYKAQSMLSDYSHDVVVLVPGASGATQEINAITWDKNYTHLVGNAAPTQIGMRARMDFVTDATDPCMTISGMGCMFNNVKIETTQASNDVMINMTGDRNYFSNIHFQGMANATAGDDATARCLTLTGSHENTYDRCTFGNDTVQRSTTNATVDLAGASKNMFNDCLFMMNADNVGPVHVKSTGTTGCSGINEFKNTRFVAKWTNKADQITGNFDLSAQTNSAWIIMSGSQLSIGADDWEAADTNILYFERATATQNVIGLGLNPAV